MPEAILIDTTQCVGCRSCQVSCKEWNDLPAENTTLLLGNLGLQNPATVSAKTLTLITYHEIADESAPGNLKYIFAKRQCMHCDDPACASACPVTALQKTPNGPVVYDGNKCIGCRYCMWACPFGAPTAQWDSFAPRIRKCTMCYDRTSQGAPETVNGHTLTTEEKKQFSEQEAVPVCVKQCPAGALRYGDRNTLLSEAKTRIKNHPEKYFDQIYGEHEAGGTNTLYLSSVPFTELGFPQVEAHSYPALSAEILHAVPLSVVGVGAILGGTYAVYERSVAVMREEALYPAVSDAAGLPAKPVKASRHHVEFAPVPGNAMNTMNVLLLCIAALGGLSFLLRFALGLGGSTHLSDTYAWGLWIAFDFVWISIAAGAFATAGLIYVFHREDLYSIGCAAVLMGLLSYSFVVATLIADLGLPWHFWQLGLQAPKHSAMFEVSWCVFLYVTILAFEFLPIPGEHWGLTRVMELWRRYNSPYVVAAVTLFVYLMSRNLVYTGLAFIVFGVLAYAFRTREGQKPVPIMLAIAAVTFSAMHQSSLGSLFLLMPDKLDPLWWSPAMPLYYFLSSVVAGTSLVVLIEMWIAKGYGRKLRVPQLAALSKITFLSLLVFMAVRIGDVIFEGQLSRAFTGPKSWLFLVEIAFGGLLPLALLGAARLRRRPRVVALATLLALLGVVLNRVSAVFFAMKLNGPMPQSAPQAYFPSVWEWGLSAGMIAAAILLFRLAVQVLPVLPKEETI
jgi:formate dehydrogenase iron-sulfur subunit